MKDIVSLTRTYLAKTEEAKKLIMRAMRLKSEDELLSFRSIMPHGEFFLEGMKHTFTFHGIGLRFQSEYPSNQNSFGRKGKYLNIDMELSGIDVWKLFYFIEEHYPEHINEFDVTTIKKHFDDLVQEKVMFKKHDLYFFYD